MAESTAEARLEAQTDQIDTLVEQAKEYRELRARLPVIIEEARQAVRDEGSDYDDAIETLRDHTIEMFDETREEELERFQKMESDLKELLEIVEHEKRMCLPPGEREYTGQDEYEDLHDIVHSEEFRVFFQKLRRSPHIPIIVGHQTEEGTPGGDDA